MNVSVGRIGIIGHPDLQNTTKRKAMFDSYHSIGISGDRSLALHILHGKQGRYPYLFTGDPADPKFTSDSGKPLGFDERWFNDIRVWRDECHSRIWQMIWSLVDECNIRQAMIGDAEGKSKMLWWPKMWGIQNLHQTTVYYTPVLDTNGKPVKDENGVPVMETHYKNDYIEAETPWLDRFFEIISGTDYLIEICNELFLPVQEHPELDNRYFFVRAIAEKLQTRYGIGKEKLVISVGPVWKPFMEFIQYIAPHSVVNQRGVDEALYLLGDFDKTRVQFDGDGGSADGEEGPFGRKIMTMKNGADVANAAKRLKVNRVVLWNQWYGGNLIEPPHPVKIVPVWKHVVEIVNPVVPEPPQPEPPMVEVTLCKVSDCLPTKYCMETYKTTIPAGKKLFSCPVERKHPSCHDKYIAHRPMSKWQIGKYLKCKLGL